VESFRAAVETGVDTIELDVLWLRDSHLPLEERHPLVIAHDWEDAERRTPLKLTEALDAFLEPPLDRVEIDLDIKLPGREEEVVAALRERDLVERAMISTMEMHTLKRVLELEPALRRGWTYPKVTKDWTSRRWAKLPMRAALVGMRTRLPGLAAEKLPQFNVAAMWVYHPLVSVRLARICDLAGVELIAWTVDDLSRMRQLQAAGVHGICSNDPRLFRSLTA
jgi:glycerophosphoryl diester phosphodiesterase